MPAPSKGICFLHTKMWLLKNNHYQPYWSSLNHKSILLFIVQSLSHVRLFATPRTAVCQASFPVLHYLPVCSNSCPLSWWCHPTISSSVTPFSSQPQYKSIPASYNNSHIELHEKRRNHIYIEFIYRIIYEKRTIHIQTEFTYRIIYEKRRSSPLSLLFTPPLSNSTFWR